MKPFVRNIKRWDDESILRLQGCLACTDWDSFRNASDDIHEYADTVTSYISFCQDLCIPEKSVKVFGNDKPWFNKYLKIKLKQKEEAFKSGDRALYKKAKYGVEKAIRGAKTDYRRKLEGQFLSNDTRSVWQGLQCITGYKQKHSIPGFESATPDNFNNFYARFDRQNLTTTSVSLPDPAVPLPPPFTVQEHEVRKLLREQSSRKAAGPDNVSTSTLKYCANELATVFTDLFNASLNLHTVPVCFKAASIIPVPKKPKATALNDFRPVALTSVVMKVFERLVLRYLKSVTNSIMDSLQFAYRENRCTDDAVALALHFVMQHLDYPNTYARILFVDYSSAFNTVIPQQLYDKLHLLSIDPSMCYWLLDFLLQRSQVVKMNSIVSSTIIMNTGTPQGCVLSPLLYSLFTNDCVSHHSSVPLLKFADDTTLIGLVSDSDESEYRHEVSSLVSWCDTNNLQLNASKTREMIVDFRKRKSPLAPIIVNGDSIERVDCFKFLGTIISNDLTWENNTDAVVKKAQQRLFFLRQLKKFGLRREILVQFYRSAIESILTFSICVWFGGISQRQRGRLDRVVKTASKIVGSELTSLTAIYKDRSKKRAGKIISDQTHPAHHLFELLPSGKRYRCIRTKTNRFRNSFYPSAVAALSGVKYRT